ncbi:HelD family protein [Fontibacillus sp. BL9]|uniref:HelD family protein n=1 Tax=Fontibacillus sp. BL9 TaxID=3389971 RepID=UPI00397C242F
MAVINETEAEERAYLETLLGKVRQAIEQINEGISSSYREIIEAKKYVWENIGQLDPAERAANRIEIGWSIDAGEKSKDKLRKLYKLEQSPFFGRIDFRRDDESKPEPYYIGIHSFSEGDSQTNLIYDWRSPVASLFYDFGIERAAFQAPEGRIDGEITLKRQYKIKDEILDYMIETSLNINDDVLQKELSGNADEKMKNIVATIQKEQNAIIRNETSKELIIQGVAGSGKTSVALHRIAFLLYKYKGSLSSKNILILSPNKVFSDYISGVLPELGEENMLETGFQDLAAGELTGVCPFQTFNQQVAKLTEHNDDGTRERIRYKATADFVKEMEAFIAYADQAFFSPEDIAVDPFFISKEEIKSGYESLGRMPLKPRLDKLAAQLAAHCRNSDGDKPDPSSAKKIKTAVKKMFRYSGLLPLYREFYNYLGRPELFKYSVPKTKTVEYCDVFPLVYLKHYFEGLTPYEFVKHLLVDEMQDYSPIQYAVLSILFACKKTILGDASQSVNPYSSSSLPEISGMFPGAETVELNKSYRSTLEITSFAKKIKPNDALIPVERHGKEPQILKCLDASEQLLRIGELMDDFLTSEHHSMGIICKTMKQVEELHAHLKKDRKPVFLLDFNSVQFHEGVIITTAHLAKGLEFDRVLIPFADAETYNNELDQSLLYIACTRAMHQLKLTYSGNPSPLI